ncbi:uncharacterized protein VTP21DRAFT_9158 [Calcarisporiella thermophila]|uniref:uncharacterized protein n=1 Tax=Calcarisporiella thermophila TaxID=911321 RepID=UPI0037428E6B
MDLLFSLLFLFQLICGIHSELVHLRSRDLGNFENLVVFGGNYSDNGHARSADYWVPPPPYSDIAYRPVPCVKQQVQLYYDEYFKDGKLGLDQDKTLYAIWIGSNDIFDIYFNSSDLEKFDKSADAIGASLKNLYDHGAKHFLVLNVPPLQYMPLIKEMVKSDGTKLSELRGHVHGYNTRLNDVCSDFAKSAKDVQLTLFDSFTLFDNLINQPPPDLCDVAVACYNNGVELKYREAPGARLHRSSCRQIWRGGAGGDTDEVMRGSRSKGQSRHRTWLSNPAGAQRTHGQRAKPPGAGSVGFDGGAG